MLYNIITDIINKNAVEITAINSVYNVNPANVSGCRNNYKSNHEIIYHGLK